MNGALIIDKPAGLTSHDVVARVRKIIGERRVGHTGTLDPFATGVLVVLVGRATRLAQFLSGAEKEYEAMMRLGYATDTGDRTGTRVQSALQPQLSVEELRVEEIETALASLRGEIDQVPPMYSAKKIAGRKLYEHARLGEEVARQPIRVKIHELELTRDDHELLRPSEEGCVDLRIRTVCSAGTYVRTLAEDFGRKLDVGAHLVELRRTRAGAFQIENAVTLDELAERMTSTSVDQILISPNNALPHLALIELNDEQTRRVVHGNDLGNDQLAKSWRDGDSIRLVNRGELIAVGKFDGARATVHPAVVLTSA